jgi:acyl-CoA synthetase (AMP-forming)/AMP-acid ligase II
LNLPGFITLPLYHTYGIIALIGALLAGNVLSLYNANLPITGTNLVEAIKVTKPDVFYGVPYTLKLMAETEDGMNVLKNCKMVAFGGSSCPDELGEKLTKEGVGLISYYGS